MVRAMLARGDRRPRLESHRAKGRRHSKRRRARRGRPRRSGARRRTLHSCLGDDASVDAVARCRRLRGIDRTSVRSSTTRPVLPQRVTERARSTRRERTFVAARAGLHGTADGARIHRRDDDVRRSALVETLRPALEAMCSDLRYVGPRAEAAAIYKLMGNAMILAVVGGINDMIRIGEDKAHARASVRTLRFLRPVRSDQRPRKAHGRRRVRSHSGRSTWHTRTQC